MIERNYSIFILGSLGTGCEGATGQCRCKEGFTGHKCNICPNGSVQKYGGKILFILDLYYFDKI